MIKYRHFIGLIIRTISADGIAPIKGPKNGIILVMPTKTLISKAYGILQSDVTMKQSIPMIMESIILPLINPLNILSVYLISSITLSAHFPLKMLYISILPWVANFLRS